MTTTASIPRDGSAAIRVSPDLLSTAEVASCR
jgi:hypothetical protein